jgi:hypothetical protein
MELDRFIEKVTERDIDLLLLEELHISESFRRWILKRSGLAKARGLRLESACRSVSHLVLGESDLEVVLSTPDGVKHALLIEDKIDASPQPEQAERYRKRGEAGVEARSWDDYRTCIIAPEGYVKSVGDANRYDSKITYEAIRQWFLDQADDAPRGQYRARMLKYAIEQYRRGYNPITDPSMSEFRNRYFQIVEEQFPELKMRTPREVVPARASWMRFYPKDLPKGFVLRHKTRHGRVDLEMRGCAEKVDQIRVQNRAVLDDDMEVMEATKSAAVSIAVPEIDPALGLETQLAKVMKGLAAGVRLWKVASRIKWQN